MRGFHSNARMRKKSEKKRAVCLTPKKKLDDVHENININQKEHRKGMTIVKLTKDYIETNSNFCVFELFFNMTVS